MSYSDFRDAYVACALWSTNADHLDPEGTGEAGALEDHVSRADFSEELVDSLNDDCLAFWTAHCQTWTAHGWSDAQAGHDFWLTRNGHGAGFWDRGFGRSEDYRRAEKNLTDASTAHGETHWYIGDDGKVYA